MTKVIAITSIKHNGRWFHPGQDLDITDTNEVARLIQGNHAKLPTVTIESLKTTKSKPVKENDTGDRKKTVSTDENGSIQQNIKPASEDEKQINSIDDIEDDDTGSDDDSDLESGDDEELGDDEGKQTEADQEQSELPPINSPVVTETRVKTDVAQVTPSITTDIQEKDSPLVIDGISKGVCTVLFNNGCKTVDDVKKMTLEQLVAIPNLGYPNAKKVFDKLKK